MMVASQRPLLTNLMVWNSFLPCEIARDSQLTPATAGLAYCAVGTLSFLDCVSPTSTASSSFSLAPGTSRFEDLVHWLACRQTAVLQEEESESEDDEEDPTSTDPAVLTNQGHGKQLGNDPKLSLDDRIASLPDIVTAPRNLSYAGFNGRMNKIADTCYCFWVSGSLAVTHPSHCSMI